MATPWWAGPIWQGFKWTTSNEAAHSGIDIGEPWGTPYTALLPGTVTVASWEPWGYQVSYVVALPVLGNITITGLHGSALNTRVGAKVEPGTLLMKTGAPPSPQYGSGDHLHFEVNTGTEAPYVQYNVQKAPSNNHPISPQFLLDAAKKSGGFLVASSLSSTGVAAGVGSSIAGSSTSGLSSSIAGISNPIDPTTWINAVWSFLQGKFPSLFSNLPNLGWDALKMGLGGLIITGCMFGLIINIVGPTALQVVGLSAGGGAGRVIARAASIKPAPSVATP